MKKPAILFVITLSVACACAQRGGPEPPEPSANDSVPAAEEPQKVATVIEKDFLYEAYALADTFPYKDTFRLFQWDKIRARLAMLDSLQSRPTAWGFLRNHRNRNGEAPLVRTFTRNAYRNIQDAYGVERYQSVPLYLPVDSVIPERYERDGALVKLLSEPDSAWVAVEAVHITGPWLVPSKYVKKIDSASLRFTRVVFVDRANQNIATLERVDDKWLVRSMNPATTGLHRPPYQKETPLGVFVVQEKKPRMLYYVDGTTEIGGFAPYASRFCNGAYVHGVPVNRPHEALVEYSRTLGTTPRSHMCVRNATSHARFVYDWAPVEQALVCVIE